MYLDANNNKNPGASVNNVTTRLAIFQGFKISATAKNPSLAHIKNRFIKILVDKWTKIEL